jgi:hypothetical protein
MKPSFARWRMGYAGAWAGRAQYSHRGGDRRCQDVRWKLGLQAVGNANFARMQRAIDHLSSAGIAASGSMSSSQCGEEETRKNLIV